MRRGSLQDQESTDRWMLTYADLITLLLAFFVVMYSMSRIDAKKFGKMSERLQGVFRGVEAAAQNAADVSDLGSGVLRVGKLKLIAQKLKSSSTIQARNRFGIGAQASWIKSDSGATGLSSEPVSTEINERGLVIHIREWALFESGQATLRPDALEMLNAIGRELRDIPNHIRVEGHTDDRPITTARFPSNWELSAGRAIAVVKHLIGEFSLPPGRVSALGYGEYRPLAPNDTPENRARNRRVDIVVLTENLSRFEPGAPQTPADTTARKELQVTLEDFALPQ